MSILRNKTLNREAFENVKLGLGYINEYNLSKNFQSLEHAESNLSIAYKNDPNYFDAILYLGVTKDLIGKPVDSIPLFERIRDLSKDRTVKIEAEYNLGVSYYHRYGHKYLAEAEKYFQKVLNETKDRNLRALTCGNLAQTYAMFMIPNSAQRKEGRVVCEKHVNFYYALFEEAYQKGEEHILKIAKNRKAKAMLFNAKGMALMYFSDYESNLDTRRRILSDAESILQEVDELMPKDWANVCDLGSVYMRIAYNSTDIVSKNAYYDKSTEALFNVLTALRPNYGFAYYELGRMYRIRDIQDKAKEYFEKSLDILEQYRDVGDNTVNREIERSAEADTSFP